MAEGKERSALFKFLYMFIRIITFPIFAVLYVLKHPLWVLFIVFIGFGVVIYYPLQQGVELKDVTTWYKNRYTETKLNVAHKVAGSGDNGLLSEEALRDLQDEVDASKGLKGENYNAKLSRDKEVETKTTELKKRGGFKRKNMPQSEDLEEDTFGLENVTAGGLEALLQGNKEKAAESEHDKEVMPEIEENTKLENPVEIISLPQPVVEASQPQKADIKEEDALDEFELF